jgi:hypothetical protein
MDYCAAKQIRDQDVINHYFLQKFKKILNKYFEQRSSQINNDNKTKRKDPNRIMIFEMDL